MTEHAAARLLIASSEVRAAVPGPPETRQPRLARLTARSGWARQYGGGAMGDARAAGLELVRSSTADSPKRRCGRGERGDRRRAPAPSPLASSRSRHRQRFLDGGVSRRRKEGRASRRDRPDVVGTSRRSAVLSSCSAQLPAPLRSGGARRSTLAVARPAKPDRRPIGGRGAARALDIKSPDRPAGCREAVVCWIDQPAVNTRTLTVSPYQVALGLVAVWHRPT